MSCPVTRHDIPRAERPSNSDLAKEMERRLAELQSARTTQEAKLGIGAVSVASVAALTVPTGLTQTIVRSSIDELEKIMAERENARTSEIPNIKKTDIAEGVFGKKSRVEDVSGALEGHLATLAASRGEQDHDFENMASFSTIVAMLPGFEAPKFSGATIR